MRGWMRVKFEISKPTALESLRHRYTHRATGEDPESGFLENAKLIDVATYGKGCKEDRNVLEPSASPSV